MSLNFYTSANQDGFDNYKSSTRVIAAIPNEVNCNDPTGGWDVVSGGCKNIACPTCGGVGKIITWVNYTLNARLIWDPLKFIYMMPSSGTVVGDCLIFVGVDWVNIMDKVMDEPRAFIRADDKIVRPNKKQLSSVGGLVEEYEYTCNIFTPSTD